MIQLSGCRQNEELQNVSCCSKPKAKPSNDALSWVAMPNYRAVIRHKSLLAAKIWLGCNHHLKRGRGFRFSRVWQSREWVEDGVAIVPSQELIRLVLSSSDALPLPEGDPKVIEQLGMTYLSPDSACIKLLKPFLAKKKRLGIDKWDVMTRMSRRYTNH